LRGEIPSGERCDVKTLAAEAGVDRTALYDARPYAHLRIEFEQRLRAMQQTGDIPDPRDAQILRLKADNRALSGRLAEATGTIDELTDFRAQAIARLAAQHEEITRLRQAADEDARTSITRLPRASSPREIGVSGSSGDQPAASRSRTVCSATIGSGSPRRS
jgi:hypothetical protein